MSIATEERTVVEKVQNKLYIGGEWRDATGDGTLEVSIVVGDNADVTQNFKVFLSGRNNAAGVANRLH